MANRRTTKFSHLAEQENVNSFLRSENQSLRRKNEELAKALSNEKMEQQKLVERNLEMRERLHSIDVQRNKYKEFVRALSLEMHNYIHHFFSLTEQMTNMLNKINMVAQCPDVLNQLSNSSTSHNSSAISTPSNKTMAVMPMVSGHTIWSPKVNLSRVTAKQLTDMMHASTSEPITENEMETDEIEFADDNLSNREALAENTTENESGPSNRRLETLQEEEEEERSNISNPQPLLSGVFKDIRVYISPMSPQHIIKFEHKTPRKVGQKSFNSSSNSLATRSPSNGSGDNSTLTARNDSTSTSSNNMDNSSNISRIKNVTTPLRNSLNNVSNANAEDYDPMEGPSNIWRSTQNVNATIFKPTPNETSTPYSPKIPQNISSSSSEQPTTPIRSLQNVTRRKDSKRTRTASAKLSNCSVRLQKLSAKRLKSLVSSSTANETVSPKKSNVSINRERDDSPTILERSRRSTNSLDISSRRQRSSAGSSASPKLRRARRNVQPGIYKEPSLHKKMRR
ncbi:hypothetical protein Trydic_g13709 [Trypoxylus dichotomus]